MATNVNFQIVSDRAKQKSLVQKAENDGATRLSSFTILPAGLSMRCKVIKTNNKLRLFVGTFTTNEDKVLQGAYFDGVDETTGKKYYNFAVGMNDAEIDDLVNNSDADYQITTSEYTNTEGKKRTVAKFESVFA